MLESTSRLLSLVEHVASHLMQQPEGQSHRPPNQRNKKFFDVLAKLAVAGVCVFILAFRRLTYI